MAFDYKKEYKEFYMPKDKPSIVDVPTMNYIAVRGHGDPNQEDGDYQAAIGKLYAIAFTIKMSKKGDHQIEGSLSSNAFYYTPISSIGYIGVYGSIFVPESLYSSYLMRAGWSYYSNRIVSYTEEPDEDPDTDTTT